MTYTPMILADVFRNSKYSRQAEFNSYLGEGVVVQFAVNDAVMAADAAELVCRYSSGVDLNCGCPQKWAIQEGIGCALLQNPELVKDIVRQVKQRTSSIKMANGKSFPCSTKIRVHSNIAETVELVRRAEQVGVDWIIIIMQSDMHLSRSKLRL